MIHPAYEQMVRIAAPLLRRFMTDLTKYDAKELKRAQISERFVWAIWTSGTYIVWPDRRGECNHVPLARILRSIEEGFEPIAWHIWNGRTLAQKPLEQICSDLLEADHATL